jgi:3-oxoadipate enol-lactonase
VLDFTRHDGGDDGTIVLLHSLALDRSVWNAFVPFVVPRFDVVVPDLPGHGRSPDAAVASIEGFAEEVAMLIEQISDDPIIVVGMSLGGCIAQATAVRHPQLVRGLGLVDTTCWYGETAAADWEGRAQRAVANGLSSLADFQIARWFSAGFLEQHPETGRELLNVFERMDVDSYVATCRAMGSMDLRENIGNVTVPTCIIVGADDPATPPSHSEEIRRHITHAGLHVVPDSSHLSCVERPGAVAEILGVDLFDRV